MDSRTETDFRQSVTAVPRQHWRFHGTICKFTIMPRVAAKVFVAALPVVVALAACAPTLTPRPGWTRGLCVEKAVAVQSPWDDTVSRIHLRLASVARADMPTREVVVVVVAGPPTVDGYTMAGGWICRSDAGLTLALHAWTVEAAFSGDDPEAALARVIAHELAHAVLHFDPVGAKVEKIQREYEADYLGAYYYARAGFRCQAWLDDLRRMMSQTALPPGRIVIGATGRSREVIGLRQEAVERGCRQAATGQSPLHDVR